MRRKIENFSVMIGDLALSKAKRNHVDFIEVAYTNDDKIRALYTYDTVQLYSGNIPDKDIEYVTKKVRDNKKYLEV